MNTPPVTQIDPNSVMGQLFTLLRYMVVTGGGYAIGSGTLSDEQQQLLLVLVTIVLPSIYGMYATWKNEQTKRHLSTGETVGVIKSGKQSG